MPLLTSGRAPWLYSGELYKLLKKFNTDTSLITELSPQLCDEYQFHCIMNQCSLSHLKYTQLCMLCTQAAHSVGFVFVIFTAYNCEW